MIYDKTKVSKVSNGCAIVKVACYVIAIIGILAAVVLGLDYYPLWWAPIALSFVFIMLGVLFAYLQNSMDIKQYQAEALDKIHRALGGE